jgi:hypothetical protein
MLNGNINSVGKIADTSGDKINFDNGIFVIDETNNRVGIGTASPDRRLEVNQGLQVVSTKITGNNSGGHLIDIDHANVGVNSYNGFRFLDEGSHANGLSLTHIGASSGRGKLQIGPAEDGSSAILSVDGDSTRVGVGTLSPASTLEVEGVISSQGANLTLKDNSGSNITAASQSEGKITVTHNYHQVIHNESGTDTADVRLIDIDGGVDGAILVLKQQSNDKDIKLIDNTGNLRLNGDFQMTTGNDTITLIYSGSHWFEISRSDNA